MSDRVETREPTRPVRWTLSWSDPPPEPPAPPRPVLPPGAAAVASLLADHPGEWAEVLELDDRGAAELLADALAELGLDAVVGRRGDGGELGASVYAAHLLAEALVDEEAETGAAVATFAHPPADGPTPEQAAAIEELVAENAAAVSALRASRRSEPLVRGRLPATTAPVSVNELPRYLRPTARAALAEGWVVGRQGNEHFRWAGPGGESVSTPSTGNSNGSAPRNVLGSLRRAGVPVTSLRG